MRKILISLFCIASSFCMMNQAISQINNVTVNLLLSPPYSPYLTDYLVYENRAAVIITGMGRPGSSADVYFRASITGDNGVVIKTKDNYTPTKFITLFANQPKKLLGLDIQDLMDWKNLEVLGVSVSDIIRSNGVPEGNYTICFQAFEAITNNPLSAPNPVGCSSILIQHVDPPLPLSPFCDSEVKGVSPQNILFNWSYNPGVTPSVRYLLKMVEVLPGQNPNDAINSQITPAMFEKIITNTSYLYSVIDPALKEGRKYAWRITAYDLDKKIKFKNNGESQVCTFDYTPLIQEKFYTPPSNVFVPLPIPPVIIQTPGNPDSLVVINPECGKTLTIQNDTSFFISWLTKKQNDLLYGSKKLLDNAAKQAVLDETKNWKFAIAFVSEDEFLKHGKNFDNTPICWYTSSFVGSHYEIKEYIEKKVGNKVEKNIPLENNKRYYFKVKAWDSKINDRGWSNVCSFTFKNHWKTMLNLFPSQQFTGELKYKFDGGIETWPIANIPYGVYDVFYIEDSKGVKYRMPSSQFGFSDNVLAGGSTDKNGKFNVSISKFLMDTAYGLKKLNYVGQISWGGQNISVSGKLYHALYVLPLSAYYPLTDQYIFPNKTATFDCGTLIYKLYKYDVTIRLHKKYFIEGKAIVDDGSVDLMGKTVYILRKKYPWYVPQTDGDLPHSNLTLSTQINEEEVVKNDFIVVAKTKTILGKDNSGSDAAVASFSNLICNWTPEDEYFIYVQGEPVSTMVKGQFAPSFPYNPFVFNYQREFDDYLVSNLPPKSTITGKLVYKYADPGETEQRPLAYRKIKVQSFYVMTGNGDKTLNEVLRTPNDVYKYFDLVNQKDAQAIFGDMSHLSEVLATTTTASDGTFNIELPYSFIVGKDNKVNYFKAGDIEFVYGSTFKHVLRIIVDDKYFCSPDDDISIEPFKTKDAGTLTSLVKSFKLSVSTYSSVVDPDMVSSGENGKLSGIKVKVRRYNPQFIYDNYFVPTNEGDQVSDTSKYISPYGKTISEKITNEAAGNCVFTRMVRHVGWSSEDQYYITTEQNQLGMYSYFDDKISDHELNFLGRTTKLGDIVANDIYSNVFNSEYKYITVSQTFKLIPKFPIVTGRIVNSASANKGLPWAWVKLGKYYNFLSGLNGADYQFTDADGYFRFENKIFPQMTLGQLKPIVSVDITKTGYYYQGNDMYSNYLGALKMGQNANLGEIPFTPNAVAFGYLKDEEGKMVEAFVRIGDEIDDKYTNGAFAIPAASLGWTSQKFYILPLDPKYFPDTIELKPNKGWNNLGTIDIHTRKHRLLVRIKDDVNAKGIEGCTVSFPDLSPSLKFTTNGWGFTNLIEFYNIASKNFMVKIQPPLNSGYPTKYFTINNAEQKSGSTIYEYTFSKGKTLSGTVFLENKPFKNAIVYTKGGSGTPLNYTLTDNAGHFVLGGLSMPPSQIITVYAADAYNFNLFNLLGTPLDDDKKASPVSTIVGTRLNIHFAGVNSKVVDLNLTNYTKMDLNQIMGMPVIIESLVDNPNGASVSGLLILKANDTYHTLLGNEQIGFKNVNLIPSQMKNSKGIPYGKLDGDSILLSSKSLKVKYKTFYNFELTNFDGDYLYLTKPYKSAESGELKALSRIVDNTFNVPSSYLHFDDDQFCIATSITYGNGKVDFMPRPVFFAPKGMVVSSGFSVSDKNFKPIKFQYYGFDAQAIGEVTLYEDKITVPVLLSTVAEESKFDSIRAGKLILHPGFFEPIVGKEPLSFTFEKWKVIVNNWTLDHTQGGFSSSDGVIKTGLVDISFGQFIFKANHLPYFDNFNLNNLSLGGLLPLTVTGTNKHMGYDLKTGSDMKPHWKFSIVGGNDLPAASFGGLPGMKNNDKIDILVVSILSNSESLVTLSSETKPIQFNNGVNFKPISFYIPMNSNSVADGFSMSGLMDVGIPRIQSNVNSIIHYSGSWGNLKMSFNPMNFDFEGKGFVKFKSKGEGQSMTPDELTIYGTLEEPGKFAPMNVVLRRKANSISINEFNPASIQIGAAKTYLQNPKCNMSVEGSDWGLMSFEGDLLGFTGTGTKPGDAHMKFTVYGEIKAENQKLKVDNIDTGFGNMALTFDFANKRLLGNLELNNINYSGMAVEAQANILMDGDGWYFAASGTVTTPAIGTFAAGILVGNYPYQGLQQLGGIKTLMANAYDKSVPCSFQTDGLKGFMITGKRELKPIPDFSLDLGIVSASLSAAAGIDARVYMNFGKGYGLSAVAFADVVASCSSITCTNLSGAVNAEAKISASLTSNSVSFDACGSVTLDIKAEQCVPTLLAGCTPCVSIEKGLGIAYVIHAGSSDGFYQKMLWTGPKCTDSQDCPLK